MQRKVLIAIFAILFFIIVAILASLLTAQSVDDVPSSQIMKNVMEVAKKASNPQNWTSKLADIKKTEHHLPVNELYVQIDLEQAVINQSKPQNTTDIQSLPKKESYRLVVDREDRYSLYCIRQTLNVFPYPYSVVKEKGKTFVFVNSEDGKSLEEIVLKLKDYDIKSTIEKVWL